MPAYSFGHRWVGVISGHEPPTLPTLMALARRTGGRAPLAGAPRKATIATGNGNGDRGSRGVSLEVWGAALFDAIGPEDLERFAQARDRCQASLVIQRRASGRRGRGRQRLRRLRKATRPRELAERAELALEVQAAIADYAAARAVTTAAIAEMEQIVAAARETLIRLSRDGGSPADAVADDDL